MKSSMSEALRRRRGKGVDISIVLGEPHEIKSQMHGDSETEGDDEAKDLAPEVKNESRDLKEESLEGAPVLSQGDAVEHADEAQDLALLAKILGKGSLLSRHMKKG